MQFWSLFCDKYIHVYSYTRKIIKKKTKKFLLFIIYFIQFYFLFNIHIVDTNFILNIHIIS